jgi:hypothetical protein
MTCYYRSFARNKKVRKKVKEREEEKEVIYF